MEALYQLSYSPRAVQGTSGVCRCFSLVPPRARPVRSPPMTDTSASSSGRADSTGTARASRTRSRPSGRTAGSTTTRSGRPTRSGPLSDAVEPGARASTKLYVLDMFPYPSGEGLHVGHPVGYIGTDVYARFMRMNDRNVLHAMGYDSFGLPAEQFAVEHGQHPRATVDANVATMRRQLRALGLAHDPRRGIDTTDVRYYRWTQWIFLQIFNSWFDDDQGACPSDHRARRRVRVRHARTRERRQPRRRWRGSTSTRRRAPPWSTRTGSRISTRRSSTGARRSAPCWRTRKSRPTGAATAAITPCSGARLKQWKLQITAYADRLLADLDLLDWPESIKTMQRNWIGRSVGATVAFPVEEHEGVDIEVFTTRPDTLFGATYMVLAPEHPLLDEIVPSEWPDANLAADLGDMPAAVEGHLRDRRAPAGGGAALPRVRRAEVGARAAGRRPREDRCVHRRVRQEPHERLERADLRGRLRAHGVRHRGDHGGAGPRPARLRVRPRVRPPDRRRGAPARRLAARTRCRCRHARRRMARGVRRRRRGHELVERRGVARRPAHARSEAADRRVAGGERNRRRRGDLQAARLAVQPPAVLGRAVPDRLRRRRQPARGAGIAPAGRASRDDRLRAAHPRRRRPVAAGAAARARRRLGERRARSR